MDVGRVAFLTPQELMQEMHIVKAYYQRNKAAPGAADFKAILDEEMRRAVLNRTAADYAEYLTMAHLRGVALPADLRSLE